MITKVRSRINLLGIMNIHNKGSLVYKMDLFWVSRQQKFVSSDHLTKQQELHKTISFIHRCIM